MVISATANGQTDNESLVFTKTRLGEFVWRVELADDDKKRAKGLMFRKSMPPANGMLFKFDSFQPVAMWMKNTYLPLDMIFTYRDGTVSHIHKGAVPLSLDIISSNGPAAFVLEVNAGEVIATGLRVGDKLVHPWFQRKKK